MDGATLLFASIAFFVLMGILRTILKRHQEAIILEQKLGRETYQWLISTPAENNKNAELFGTNKQRQLNGTDYFRGLINYGLQNNLNVLLEYLLDKIRKPEPVLQFELKRETKGTVDANQFIAEKISRHELEKINHHELSNHKIPKRIRDRGVTIDIN